MFTQCARLWTAPHLSMKYLLIQNVTNKLVRMSLSFVSDAWDAGLGRADCGSAHNLSTTGNAHRLPNREVLGHNWLQYSDLRPWGNPTMVGKLHSAVTILAATLAFGMPARGLEAAQGSTAPKETQSPTKAVGSQQRAASASRETTGSASSAPPATEPPLPEFHPSSETKILDAVAVRPITFVSSVFSAGAFLLALPFAAIDPALSVEQTRKNLVDYPLADTFKRPLGDFSGSAW
jgi:hypothetical protein